MRLLGLCGSLRDHSSNALLLKAAQKKLLQHQWSTFDLSLLPYFDPDQQYAEVLPESVSILRAQAAAADKIFIATPEYAHGLPGILKNALEWMFHEGTQRKPVYVVIGSAQGENTREQLIEILRTMDFVTGPEHMLLVKGARSKIKESGEFIDGEAEKAFTAFCQSVN